MFNPSIACISSDIVANPVIHSCIGLQFSVDGGYKHHKIYEDDEQFWFEHKM